MIRVNSKPAPNGTTLSLLGPQGVTVTVTDVVESLGLPDAPIATITAGWQERESEDEELTERLGRRTLNLALHRRGDRVFATDAEFREAHRTIQRDLKELRRLYNVRLAAAMDAALLMLRETGDSELLRKEQQAALDSLRDLDSWHLDRVRELRAEFVERWRPLERDSISRERDELAHELRDSAAVVIPGGHVAVLLNRMRLFDTRSLLEGKTIIAWSAGAMVLGEQGGPFSRLATVGAGERRGVRGRTRSLSRHRAATTRTPPTTARGRAARRSPGAAFSACSLPGPGVGHAARLGRHVLGRARRRLRFDCGGRARGDAPLAVTGRVLSGRPPLAINAFVASGDLRPPAIDRFVSEHEFPLVEGTSCTFVFRGPADSVRLRHWIYGLPSTQPMKLLPGTDLWYVVQELPEGSRVEYKIEVARGQMIELLEDPLNEVRAHDPFGANSVAHAHGYETPDWTLEDETARSGVLRDMQIHSRVLRGPRHLTLYLPARFRPTRRYPLLIVHDGPDYLRFSNLQTVLDNLIHRLEIPGMIAALLHPRNRMREYAASEEHARFLTEELVPHLESEYPLEGDPRGRCLMGASFGAVAALSTAAMTPDFYGRLLLQSGSFAFSDIGKHKRGPAFDPIVEFINDYRANPVRAAEKAFVSCGMYESLIYENRSMVPLFQGTGMDIRYSEARDGHNWENWRDRLREGLSWLFPGPLWMVYE